MHELNGSLMKNGEANLRGKLIGLLALLWSEMIEIIVENPTHKQFAHNGHNNTLSTILQED
jgi:hypothetical protein